MTKTLCLRTFWEKEKGNGFLENDLKNVPLEGFYGFRKKLFFENISFGKKEWPLESFLFFGKQIF